MAISAGMAIMSTATTGAMIGAGMSAAYIGGTMMTHFLVTTAMGAALNALAPKPSIPNISTGSNAANRGYQISSRGSAQNHQIIYGQTKVGGAIVFDAVSGVNNKILHRVIAFSGHEIEEFSTFYFNDEALTLTTDTDSNGDTYYKPTVATTKTGATSTRYNDYVRIYQRKGGTENNTAITALISGGVAWTQDHKLQGVAYAYFRMEFDADAFPNGVPKITCIIKGKKVYDPRSSSTAWSDNPALCLRDYITSTSYGLGEGSASIDDDAVTVAADVCQYKTYNLNSSNLITATNLRIFYSNGSDQGTLEITDNDHGLSSGDTVNINTSTITNWFGILDILNLSSVDLTSIENNSIISATTSTTFTVPITYTSSQTTSGQLSQAGTYYYKLIGTGGRRFTMNGSFTTAVTPHDHMMDMLTSMAGLIWYGQGKWRMKAGYYVAPTITFTEDDLRSNVQVSTRHSRRDNFNTVKGVFRGPATDYQPTDYAEVTNAAFRTADNNQISTYDLDLPFTDSFDIARRLALITLERNRQQLTVQVSLGMRAFQVQVGDIVRMTIARFGWTNKEYEVVQWTFGLQEDNDLRCNLVLREISASVFDDISDGIVYERDNTTLLSPFEVPPVAIATSNEYGGVFKVVSEKLLRELQLDVTAADASRIDRVEVQYRVANTGDYLNIGTGGLGRYSVLDLDEANYDARVRGVNTFGVKGEYSYLLNFLLAPLDTPPADVVSNDFIFEVSGGTLFLQWEPIADLDLSYYQIKYSSDLTTASTSDANALWGGSSNVAINRVARPATFATVPARSGTFLIKAYDKAGNPSNNAAFVVIPAAALPTLGVAVTQTESGAHTFAGNTGISNTNITVDTSPNPDELRINDTSAATPSGIYYFGGNLSGSQTDTNGADYIDLGSSRTATTTGSVTFARHIDYASVFDNIPQNWDTWPDTFDDWTNEDAAFGDFSTSVQVRSTPDNPASSPTWGAWENAIGQQVVGRGFQFRVNLNATNTEVSPAITVLSATVGY